MEKFGTFVRAAFYLYGGLFWKNDNCFKKTCFFCHYGTYSEAEKYWILTIFCPHCCQNFNLNLQNNNLSFFEQFLSSYAFLRSEQELLRLVTKNFGTFVETAFYVYRQTIWRGTNFSKEYISSYVFFWLGEECNLTSHNLVSALLTRLLFLFPELNFEIFSNNFEFSHQFCDFSLNFSIFSSKLSAQSSKMHLRWANDHLMKNWFSVGKCNSFS